MKKEVIILQHGGGELANQLWNFVSIFSYCEERGYICKNYSFYEYGHYFDIPVGNFIIENIFFKPFVNHHSRRNNLKNKFFRNLYKIYEKFIKLFYKNCIVSSENLKNEITFLPPSGENELLSKIEKRCNKIFFTGWLFRNPAGIIKYHEKIVEYFKPKNKYTEPIENKISLLKNTYKKIIGVHIRQGDYNFFKNGKYLICQERVVEIIEEYLREKKLNKQDVIFMVTSDGKIKKELFKNLNIEISNGNAIEDLYLLSQCDEIIGSDSSFGNFAAYYGNIVHIVMKNEEIDWEYYKHKDKYFFNKYCTLIKNQK